MIASCTKKNCITLHSTRCLYNVMCISEEIFFLTVLFAFSRLLSFHFFLRFLHHFQYNSILQTVLPSFWTSSALFFLKQKNKYFCLYLAASLFIHLSYQWHFTNSFSCFSLKRVWSLRIQQRNSTYVNYLKVDLDLAWSPIRTFTDIACILYYLLLYDVAHS